MANGEEKLKRQFKFITRWIFKDILVNIRSTKCIWWQNDLHKAKIYDFNFELDESNTGALQLICAAIETYGRIMLGYGTQGGKTEESFIAFLSSGFWPKEYKVKANEIYTHYRCGLLHSYTLGYRSHVGFFPTRGNDRQFWNKHLWFTDISNGEVSKTKNPSHQRLIINIDTFFEDFKKAVEKYIDVAINDKKIKNFDIKIRKEIKIKSSKDNAINSLEETPEDN